MKTKVIIAQAEHIEITPTFSQHKVKDFFVKEKGIMGFPIKTHFATREKAFAWINKNSDKYIYE